MPTLFPYAEGHTCEGAIASPLHDPAPPATLSMSGSYLHRSWVISSVPEEVRSGGAGKGNHTPAADADEKSDASVVPEKPPNKGQPAEAEEGKEV